MSPLSRCLLVVASLGLLTVPVHDVVAAEDAPILWTGTIRSAAGAGAPAAVSAYFQPPASNIGEDDIALKPIASTTADPEGRFTLRAPYNDVARSAADPAGWVAVLVVATTADGTSMATDSVRFDERHGNWSTRTVEAEPSGAFKGQSADPAAGVPDRPAVMTLHPVPAGRDRNSGPPARRRRSAT